MNRFRSALCCLAISVSGAVAQTAAPAKTDKASAYYHYSLGHLYGEMAAQNNFKGEYVTKALDNYRLAMKADPGAAFLAEEVSDLYIQSGRLREAVTEAEDGLKQNPNDTNAHRLLGRIYTRMIGDAQAGRLNEEMLRKAIEQYQAVASREPQDIENWLVLGRLYKVGQQSAEAEKAYQKVLAIDAENEDALAGLAFVYNDLGDTKKAADILQRVAGKNPSLRTLTALANAYEQMKDFKQAAITLQRALELAPGNDDIERALAQDLLYSDQVAEALKLYESMGAADPKDAQVQLRLSQIYRQQRDFAKARAAGEKAKAIDPNDLEVQYNSVALLEAEGKVTEAIASLQQIVDASAKKSYSAGEKRNRVIFLERLGLLYRQSEQYGKAVDTFRELGVTDPDMQSRVAAQVIEIYHASKDLPKALAEADSAQKQYPNDRYVRSARASVLADMGRVDQAAAETRKLLDGKNDRETYLTLAQIYEKGKNFAEMEKAVDAADKLSNTKEEKEGVSFVRGAMLEKMKHFDAAEAEFRKVLSLNPENSSALNYLGYMLADRNVRLPEAQQMIAKALEIEPGNGAYLDSLGWVYYRLGKLPEAEAALRQAVEKTSRDPTVHDHLGDVFFKAGKVKEAIGEWQRSLKEYETAPAAEREATDIATIQRKLESARVRLAKDGTVAKQP